MPVPTMSGSASGVSILPWFGISGPSGGEKLRSWVDYDASSKELEVRVQKSGSEDRPYEPVLAHPVNFSRLWGDGANLMLGISSVSESSSKDGGNDVVGSGNVNVFSWEYRVRELPSSMHSMPVDPSACHVGQQGRHVG
ncbi:hypothetical protein MLD38_009947 [Melastoma candidum]|uniref:Uncharacterized protein n=1 Tax=Melastoma candidum TaxID=119954 RepID=A0ACB9QY88_9MYRT|nr:hypothetical protein MLD38_009947 [Melastoma candidum]